MFCVFFCYFKVLNPPTLLQSYPKTVRFSNKGNNFKVEPNFKKCEFTQRRPKTTGSLGQEKSISGIIPLGMYQFSACFDKQTSVRFTKVRIICLFLNIVQFNIYFNNINKINFDYIRWMKHKFKLKLK